MSLITTLRTPGTGRHRTPTLADQAAEIERLTVALAESERANHAMAHDLTQAVLRLATAEELLERVRQTARTQAGRAVRAEAEQARLRQAVINARPRITVAEPPRVPPYAAMSLPYPVPVNSRDTSNEITQQIPILDRIGVAS